MINPAQLMQMVSGMLRGGNPQMIAQQILRQNPQFAQALQGHNPQAMAQSMLRQAGLSPQQIQQISQAIQGGGSSMHSPGAYGARQ